MANEVQSVERFRQQKNIPDLHDREAKDEDIIETPTYWFLLLLTHHYNPSGSIMNEYS